MTFISWTLLPLLFWGYTFPTAAAAAAGCSSWTNIRPLEGRYKVLGLPPFLKPSASPKRGEVGFPKVGLPFYRDLRSSQARSCTAPVLSLRRSTVAFSYPSWHTGHNLRRPGKVLSLESPPFPGDGSWSTRDDAIAVRFGFRFGPSCRAWCGATAPCACGAAW